MYGLLTCEIFFNINRKFCTSNTTVCSILFIIIYKHTNRFVKDTAVKSASLESAIFLLHRYECFTIKYAPPRFHETTSGIQVTKVKIDDIFHILTSKDIAEVIPLLGAL